VIEIRILVGKGRLELALCSPTRLGEEVNCKQFKCPNYGITTRLIEQGEYKSQVVRIKKKDFSSLFHRN
jgi:hypothetical protein